MVELKAWSDALRASGWDSKVSPGRVLVATDPKTHIQYFVTEESAQDEHPALMVAMMDGLVRIGHHGQDFDVWSDGQGRSGYLFTTYDLKCDGDHTSRTTAVASVFIRAMADIKGGKNDG